MSAGNGRADAELVRSEQLRAILVVEELLARVRAGGGDGTEIEARLRRMVAEFQAAEGTAGHLQDGRELPADS